MAMRAIRRQLQTGMGKNTNSVLLTLSLLETCVKNCGYRFCIHVANEDFMNEISKWILSTAGGSGSAETFGECEIPIVVRDRLLSLIHQWTLAFRRQTDLRCVERTMNDLMLRGIQFPATDPEKMAPVNTPPSRSPAAAVSAATKQPASPTPNTTAADSTITTTKPTDNQSQSPLQPTGGAAVPRTLLKLLSELDQLQTNMKVFNDLLSNTTPQQQQQQQQSSASNEAEVLIGELNSALRTMQKRLMDLIACWEERSGTLMIGSQSTTDEMLIDLIRINDELNVSFIKFDRFERARNATSSNHEAMSSTTTTAGEKCSADAASINENRAAAAVSIGGDDAAQHLIEGIPDTHEDLAQMEDWLMGGGGGGDASTDNQSKSHLELAASASNHSQEASGTAVGTGISSSEFDAFLSERGGELNFDRVSITDDQSKPGNAKSAAADSLI